MLIWFAQDHPDQNWLLKGVHNRPSLEEYESDVAYFRRVAGEEGIEKLFKEKDLNLLAFSADCLFFEIASAAGKPFLLSSPLNPRLQLFISLTLTGVPIASMPLGILDYNGRPFGLGLVAQAGGEDLMIQFMSAFEASFPKRGIPSFPTKVMKKL